MISRFQTRLARGLVSLVVVCEAGATHAQWIEFTDATQSHLDLGPISDTDPLEKDIATVTIGTVRTTRPIVRSSVVSARWGLENESNGTYGMQGGQKCASRKI